MIQLTNKKVKAHYNNPNGNLTKEEMIKLIKENKVEKYVRKFQVTKNKCPNKKLLNPNIQCFHCLDCFKYAFNVLKEELDEC